MICTDANDDSDGPGMMVFGPVAVPVPAPVSVPGVTDPVPVPDPGLVTPLPLLVVVPELVGMLPVPSTLQSAAVHMPVPLVVVTRTPLLFVTVFVIVADDERLTLHIAEPPQLGRAPAVTWSI